jgi:hypothetical protein
MEPRRSPVAGEEMNSDVARAKSGLYVRAAPGLRLRDKKTERLARRVRDSMPWIQPADWPAVRTWAELEVLSVNCFAILRAAGPVNKAMEPRKLLDDYRRLRMSQHTIASSLGMTPASRMQIKATSRDVPLDLVGQLASMSEAENAVEVPSEPSELSPHDVAKTPAERPPRVGKWNVRMPDGRYRPKDAPVEPQDDLVSALAKAASDEESAPDESAEPAVTIVDDDANLF